LGNQRRLSTDLHSIRKTTLAACAGGGRVLKTLLCVHDQGGLVVVKVLQRCVSVTLPLAASGALLQPDCDKHTSCLQVYYKAGGVVDVAPYEKQLSVIK
jgi:hypothetical protein